MSQASSAMGLSNVLVSEWERIAAAQPPKSYGKG